MAGTGPAQELDHAHLLGVGVLELVHHDQAEAPTVLCRDLRMLAEGAQGEREQVVVVEDPEPRLEPGVATVHLARELDELGAEAHRASHLHGKRAVGIGGLDLGAQLPHLLRPVGVAGLPYAPEGLRGVRRVALRGREREEPSHHLEGVLEVRALRLAGLGREGLCLLSQDERPLHAVEVERELPEDVGGGPRELDRVEALQGRSRRVAQGPEHAEHRGGAVDSGPPPELEATPELRVGGVVLDDAAHLVDRPLDQVRRDALPRDLEAGVQAEGEGVPPQDARAHAMDGADPGRVHLEGMACHAPLAQPGADLLLYLVRGRMREGDHQDLVEAVEVRRPSLARAGGEGPRDPLGQGGRLARPGPCGHEERPVEGPRNALLLRCQTACH